MKDELQQEREDLIKQIKESIHEIDTEKQAINVKSLSVYDPDKVAKMLICTVQVLVKLGWYASTDTKEKQLYQS